MTGRTGLPQGPNFMHSHVHSMRTFTHPSPGHMHLERLPSRRTKSCPYTHTPHAPVERLLTFPVDWHRVTAPESQRDLKSPWTPAQSSPLVSYTGFTGHFCLSCWLKEAPEHALRSKSGPTWPALQAHVSRGSHLGHKATVAVKCLQL